MPVLKLIHVSKRVPGYISCSSCKVDMFKFPYDTQICSLRFGNVVETDKHVNLSILESFGFVLEEFYSPSNEFILKSKQAERITWQVGHAQCQHGPLTRYVKLIVGCACAGNARDVFAATAG